MATSSPTLASEKLGFFRKLAYGAGDLGPAIVSAVNGFFLYAFLLGPAGLRPAVVGLIFTIVKIWDAVNDPIIGTLSDRTRTRWGRRRPWLLFGAVPFALAFFLHWLVPPLGDAGKFWYYLVVAILLDGAFTAVNAPYAALTPELSHDYDERTSLNTFRFSFSILGGVMAAFFHDVIVTSFAGTTGYAVSAAIWGAIIIISNLITFASTRETHYLEERPEGPGFFEGLGIAFRNRPFLFVTTIYLLSWLCIQFVQTNLQLYVKYWIRAEESFRFIVIAVQFSSFGFLLVWARLSRRLGKKLVYYIGMSVWILDGIVIYFLRPGQMDLLFVLAVLAGAGVSLGYLISWSMLPDVIEYDELQTGQRREGLYYGFFCFIQKVGIAICLGLSSAVLDLAGWIRPAPGGPLPPSQPDAVLNILRIFVGPAPSLILLISFIVVHYYPITREKHAQMRAELEKRKQVV